MEQETNEILESEEVIKTLNEDKGQSELFTKFPPEERVRIFKLPFKLPLKLRELLDGLKWAIHFKKQSGVVVIDGKSGMGKTTLSFQIGSYMTPDFSLDKVYFTPKEFIKGLSETKKGDTIIFDEAMLLSSRAALSQMNRMVIQAMSMIRSKNLLVIFNVNSIFDLDRNLALSRADLLLHCYGESLTDKGKFMAFFKGSDGMDRIKQLYLNGKKYYSYNNPRSNFFTVFSAYFPVSEAEYEKKKQKYVDEFLATKQNKQTEKWIRQRDLLLKFFSQNKEFWNKNVTKIAEDIGMGRTDIYERIKLLENEGIHTV